MNKYAEFSLTADLNSLTPAAKKMLTLFIGAAREMDRIFWRQSYGDPEELLSSLKEAKIRRRVEINYGPWDRLDGDRPLLEGIGPKPAGANFYPADMSVEEFEEASARADAPEALTSPYSLVRRDLRNTLVPVPYHQAYASFLAPAAETLRQASRLAEVPAQARYLRARAEALLSDQYRPSDMAWMEMKESDIDLVIGPIETYEDRLFGCKAAAEAYVLLRDADWSARLDRYTALLPELQRNLPVPEAYKKEQPGEESDLNVYDVLYYAGDCNAGAKTIAINLPNDEEVQLKKGSRRLQLKNAMRAKFDLILVPISNLLIRAEQTRHVTFEAFFLNTLFHEVGHGLGIKHTINGGGTVRRALRDQGTTLEEGKADILSLYIIEQLHRAGELDAGSLEDHYVTFLAGIFRSIRFGASSAHALANLARLNFFRSLGAVSRNNSAGTYQVHPLKMREAVTALSERILRLQGDGDCEGATRFMQEFGSQDVDLRKDLQRLSASRIPVDVIFKQGPEVLGLE